MGDVDVGVVFDKCDVLVSAVVVKVETVAVQERLEASGL